MIAKEPGPSAGFSECPRTKLPVDFLFVNVLVRISCQGTSREAGFGHSWSSQLNSNPENHRCYVLVSVGNHHHHNDFTHRPLALVGSLGTQQRTRMVGDARWNMHLVGEARCACKRAS